MQDAKGKTLKVGQTVSFNTWDDSDPDKPKRLTNTGTVAALSGGIREDEHHGFVTVKPAKGEPVELQALEVQVK